MRPSQLEYRFGGIGTAGAARSGVGFSPQTEKPFYRVLNTPSTSASAKFRNIIPAKVDVWYDDGHDGIPQGTLDLGMEYTVRRAPVRCTAPS